MTAEELFLIQENQTHFINAFGDWRTYSYAKNIYEKDIAKTKNYKNNYFYHATGGFGESGLGNGLYLGKDKRALDNFYNLDGTEGKIITYYGEPKFIDLTNSEEFEIFESEAKKIYLDENYLRDYTVLKGFDGIRYFDIETTGEEFVLYNTETVRIMEEV